MLRFVLVIWERWFGETVRRTEAESLAHRQSALGTAPDWKTMGVLLTTALALTLQNFLDHPYHLAGPMRFVVRNLLGEEPSLKVWNWLVECGNSRIGALTWWAIVAYLTYVLLPVLVIKFAFRERVVDYGVKLHGVWNGWPIYLVFVSVMVPIVFIFSAEPHFQQTYPFYRVSPGEGFGPELIRWEILYGLQFVALEFFFRGFVLHGTKHRFGVYAVFVMMVPYCMIHFRKPMPECLASIIAGIALGLMSLKTKSVWLGAALHISVAWGMDFASLSRKGLFSMEGLSTTPPPVM
jgi:membrane protease YdiL (CAAX protease family)